MLAGGNSGRTKRSGAGDAAFTTLLFLFGCMCSFRSVISSSLEDTPAASGGPDIYKAGAMKRMAIWSVWAAIGLLLAASLVSGIRSSICCFGEAGNVVWVLLGLVCLWHWWGWSPSSPTR